MNKIVFKQVVKIVMVAVIGLPDPVWVERVHAVIVLKDGATAAENELIAFCKEHLASYKAPKSVEFIESLPKNPQGKILKRELVKKQAAVREPSKDM